MTEKVIEPEVRKVLLTNKGPAPEPPVVTKNISDAELGIIEGLDIIPTPKKTTTPQAPSSTDPKSTPPPPPPLGFRDQDKPPIDPPSDSIIGNYIPICKHMVGTLYWNILYAIFSIIPICMIFLGISNFNNCTVSRFIPIYLVVGGIFLMASQIIRWLEIRNFVVLRGDGNRTISLEVMINSVTIFWMVVGSFWVYHLYKPNFDPRKGEYCHKLTYWFTLIVVTLGYIVLVIALIMCCAICICVFIGKQSDADPIPVVIANQ